MNTPNRLTVLRLILFLPFLSLIIAVLVLKGPQDLRYQDLTSNVAVALLISIGLLFIGAMVTDWLDGYLARRNQQVTTFGKLFDPLADKVMTSSALIFLSVIGYVPLYISLLFIVRDIIVDGMRNLAAANQINVAASRLGKAKTLVQSLAVPLIMLVTPALSDVTTSLVSPSWALWVLNLPLIGAAALSLISGYQYFGLIKPLLKLK